ncbi:M1 family aminopeptidase [Corallibacter sp.]|uniref:M1 family aminopeptidase n=1 Tax=Corallibacter sp. TaxID=2038084 RepID=UPI003AB822A8
MAFNKQFIVFISFLLFASIVNSQNNSLNYKIALNEVENKIDITFLYSRKQVNDTTRFVIPTNFDNNTLDTLSIAQNITLKSTGRLIKKSLSNYDYIGTAETIEISYTISVNNGNEDFLPCNGNDYFLPILNDNFFHFYSDKSLILPDAKNNLKSLYDVNIKWENFPNHWQIANDLGVINKKHRELQQSALNITSGKIGQMLFFGGDYKKTTFRVQGINFHTFVYGKYKFQNNDVIALLKKVAMTNLKLWKQFDKKKDYVISLTQKGADCGKIGGRNMTNSFAVYMSGNFTKEQLPLIFTKAFTHEFTHTWIGGNFVSNHPKWESMRWFVEGFCEYYSIIINGKSGILPKEKVIELINQNYIKYRTSPYAQVDLNYFSKNFTFSNALDKIAYTKGASFAFYLDGFIRNKSNSKYTLTDYMRALIQSNKSINGNLDFDSMSNFANQFLQIDISALLNTYIQKGEVFALESPLVKSYKKTKVTSLDYGFDFIESAKNQTIIGVKKGSEAYKNGLRNGQKLIAIKSFSNSISDAITLEVEHANKTVEITYLPKGKVQEIEIIKDLKEFY